ncbi:probable protein S-acyltransferase 6 [Vicia villosa]|uniref:probable protein S-acyltransferase 6 n=1 Tax=Vicia villosa TaxID=3911 RepID=UPI00273A97CC|nr:probable protein S-acyltransferase 6 [Vicia villosa]
MRPPATVNSVGDTPGNTTDPSLVRTYRAWKGNNVFFLGGRLIFGPDVKSIITTVFLVVAPVAVFCALVARKLMDDFPHHSGYSILILVILHTIFVLIALVLTSGRDPGIVPRNSHPPVPEDYDGSVSINSVGEHNLPPHLPRFKELIINGITVKVKYCDTCMLYRPPRCSHCSVCDNCVERFDHHCPWVGQCIGLRNYRFYYMFVFSATLLCLYVHGFCWVYIKRIQNSEDISIWKAMIKTPASIALIIYSFIAVWFVGGLTVFHTYLISTNQSTYENFRYRYDRQVNPYNKGVIQNFKEVFFSSIPPSKNSFRSKVPIPKELSESSRRKGVDTVMIPAYNEVDEMEKNYRDEQYGKGSDLSETSVDLSRMLHTESGQRQVASFLKHSLWERSSKKWEVNPEVLDEIHDMESNRITGDSSNEPGDNSAKTSTLAEKLKEEQ